MSQLATKPYTLSLWLPGKIAPKARPRVARGRAYLPQNYREWKRLAVLEIFCQLSDRTLLPIKKASVEMVFVGKHRGDLDNMCGAVLDVLVQGVVLLDDRLSCCHGWSLSINQLASLE